jgi:hypothetical protein
MSERPKRGAATKARDLITRIANGENVNVERERTATAATSSSSAIEKKSKRSSATEDKSDAKRVVKKSKSASTTPKSSNKSRSEKSPESATLALLPIWVAAEIMSYLDLATVLALTEVSRGVRAVFRTPASAASLMPQVLTTACANHRIDLSKDSADDAWDMLKGAFGFAWTHSGDEASDECDDDVPCIKADLRSGFGLQTLHKQRCCRAMAHVTPAQRRIALVKALAVVDEKLRSDSNLCNGFISGSLHDRSLHEVAAVMKCTRHLFSLSHISYSHYHDALNAAMRDAKFDSNINWVDAADEAIDSRSWYAEEEEDDYSERWGRGFECWNCGEEGHFARDCWAPRHRY